MSVITTAATSELSRDNTVPPINQDMARHLRSYIDSGDCMSPHYLQRSNHAQLVGLMRQIVENPEMLDLEHVGKQLAERALLNMRRYEIS